MITHIWKIFFQIVVQLPISIISRNNYIWNILFQLVVEWHIHNLWGVFLLPLSNPHFLSVCILSRMILIIFVYPNYLFFDHRTESTILRKQFKMPCENKIIKLLFRILMGQNFHLEKNTKIIFFLTVFILQKRCVWTLYLVIQRHNWKQSIILLKITYTEKIRSKHIKI